MVNDNTSQVTTNKIEIFISYSWGGNSEEVVNTLYDNFISKGYNVIRDKINLGYKGSITDFMNKIGKGRIVVVVISDKYLKSANCMYEILQIKKNGSFADRIFPIVLEDANIYEPNNRLKYIKHWQDKFTELNKNLKNINDLTVIQEEQKDLRNYKEIKDATSNIISVFKDMNTLTPDKIVDNDFAILTTAIDLLIAKDNEKGYLREESTLKKFSDTQVFEMKQIIGNNHNDILQEIKKIQVEKDVENTIQTTEKIIANLDDFFKEVNSIKIKGAKNRLISNYKLLRDYEDMLILEDDPKRKMKYKCEIDTIRISITNNEMELEAFSKH